MMQEVRIIFVCFSFLFVLFACEDDDKSRFTYKFSMESVNNFKAEFKLNPDSTYLVSIYNYFFDNFENKKSPYFYEGRLSENEFDIFKGLVKRIPFKKLDNSYGFDEESSVRSIIYIIEVSKNGTSDYLSICSGTKQKFPKSVIQLIEYTNRYINAK